MADKIPERLKWTVETLAAGPAERLLEIGCGPGIAVSLLCKTLTDGHITAIDRSEKAIAAAARRNAANIASGRASFHSMSLEQADFSGEKFDKIFAVNVNLFWTHPGKHLDVVRPLLKPDGTFYIFYHPPAGTDVQARAGKLTATLSDHGFDVVSVIMADHGSASGLCIAARLPPIA